MEKAELRIIKFDSSDVIATSVTPNPWPLENPNDPNYANLFYFYGIGNNAYSSVNSNRGNNHILIRNNGQDVTNTYIGIDGDTYFISGNKNDLALGVNYSEVTHTKEYLESNYGISDGAYTFNSYFFDLFNVFKRTE